MYPHWSMNENFLLPQSSCFQLKQQILCMCNLRSSMYIRVHHRAHHWNAVTQNSTLYAAMGTRASLVRTVNDFVDGENKKWSAFEKIFIDNRMEATDKWKARAICISLKRLFHQFANAYMYFREVSLMLVTSDHTLRNRKFQILHKIDMIWNRFMLQDSIALLYYFKITLV